ncbi:flavin reductase family protein [Microbacterium insulae]|uniref:Flavin reductase family protein n=1 Tax=Microbacterium insulae TaxID=483014 RepID=A0ABW3AJ85_9MICO
MTIAAPYTETALSSDDFKAAFRQHPAGVAVITADAGRGPVMLTATSVASVSADPALLMFSLSANSSSTPTIRRAETVVVHLLGAGQLSLAQLGATSGIDRFADTSLWDRLPSGDVYFPGARAWIRGRVLTSMDAGGSAIVLVEAIEASAQEGADDQVPLVYYNRTWHELGDHSQIG